MAKYVGKRIVPLPCGEWVQTKEYEMLSVVLYAETGDSYMAKRQVPAGTAITDTAFWAKSSEWSQQVKNMSDQLTETLRQMKADNDATEAAIKADNDATENAIRQDNTNTRQHVDNITADALSRLADGSNELREAKNALTARMDSITGSATEETEVLEILTGLEIDSAKSGVKPDLSEYLNKKIVSRSTFLKFKNIVNGAVGQFLHHLLQETWDAELPFQDVTHQHHSVLGESLEHVEITTHIILCAASFLDALVDFLEETVADTIQVLEHLGTSLFLSES